MAELTELTTEQWQDVVSRLKDDDRITKQLLGFVNLISVQGIVGETLYLQVANEMTRGIIEQRIKQPLLDTLNLVG
ncbi:MAG: chromosomal replication initiator protein DnaA, partial [Rhodoluna sp.]|nr:chromosomal replication initiator protein DnaA [Rhodoluna sp.]